MFLALDSVFGQCSVALLAANAKVLSCDTKEGKRAQTEQILPMVDAALLSANVSLDELSAIVLNRGPGAFSGIRINTAVAQALSVAHDIPCIGVSSLQVIAQAAYDQHNVLACYAVHDARMKQVYIGRYEVVNEVSYTHKKDDDSKSGDINKDSSQVITKNTEVDRYIQTAPIMQPQPLSELLIEQNSGEKENKSSSNRDPQSDPNLICESLLGYEKFTPRNLPLVGDGARLLSAHADQRIIESLTIDAVILGRLGIVEYNKNGGVPAEQALPVYLRNNAWRTLKEQGKA